MTRRLRSPRRNLRDGRGLMALRTPRGRRLRTSRSRRRTSPRRRLRLTRRGRLRTGRGNGLRVSRSGVRRSGSSLNRGGSRRRGRVGLRRRRRKKNAAQFQNERHSFTFAFDDGEVRGLFVVCQESPEEAGLKQLALVPPHGLASVLSHSPARRETLARPGDGPGPQAGLHQHRLVFFADETVGDEQAYPAFDGGSLEIFDHDDHRNRGNVDRDLDEDSCPGVLGDSDDCREVVARVQPGGHGVSRKPKRKDEQRRKPLGGCKPYEQSGNRRAYGMDERRGNRAYDYGLLQNVLRHVNPGLLYDGVFDVGFGEIEDVLGEGETCPDERSVNHPIDGPVDVLLQENEHEEDPEALDPLFDDACSDRSLQNLKQQGAAIAFYIAYSAVLKAELAVLEQPFLHLLGPPLVALEGEVDGDAGAPAEREDVEEDGLGLPSVDPSDQGDDDKKRDERDDRKLEDARGVLKLLRGLLAQRLVLLFDHVVDELERDDDRHHGKHDDAYCEDERTRRPSPGKVEAPRLGLYLSVPLRVGRGAHVSGALGIQLGGNPPARRVLLMLSHVHSFQRSTVHPNLGRKAHATLGRPWGEMTPTPAPCP